MGAILIQTKYFLAYDYTITFYKLESCAQELGK